MTSVPQSIAIDHAGVGCVVAEKFPLIEARLDPAASVSRARVYFRGSGEAWYFVEMKLGAGPFSAVLPKPKKGLKQVNYYIEAVDREFGSSRTANFASDVVESAAACSGKAVAAVAAGSFVAVAAPAGAPAIPAGFSASGVASSGAATGATVAAGGGGHTTAIVIGAVAAGAAAGGAVILKKAGEDGTVVLRGYVYLGECTCAANKPPPYSWLTTGPIQGAVVSTTLNATTATTDASGFFELRTTDPSPADNNYTPSATAPGCSSSTWNGGHDKDPNPIYITLTCTNGPPRRNSCSCAAG